MVFYLLQDHLQSSSVFVNQSSTTLATNYYYPYGGNRGGAFSNLSTKRFTGQYHESSLPGGEGLSYYNARWYDAKLGRFLSADTIVPGPANPQAFNRYSYGFNNPLRFTDPTGHEPWGGRQEDPRDRSHGIASPPVNPGHYVRTRSGFTIDYSHFSASMGRATNLLIDLRRDPEVEVRMQVREVLGITAGYASTYTILGRPASQAELESVGWGIYLHSLHRFEQWQGSGWVSPFTEMWRGSSYGNEDLPSDYLGFYAAVRYPALAGRADLALKFIIGELGGGGEQVGEPAHAGLLRSASLSFPWYPIYWGDPDLKNYDSTPRLYQNGVWQNQPWPTQLQISPTGGGTYWQYQSSYNTINDCPGNC